MNEDLINYRSEDYWRFLNTQPNKIEVALNYIEFQQQRRLQALSDKDWNKANEAVFEIESAKLAIRNLDPKHFGASYVVSKTKFPCRVQT